MNHLKLFEELYGKYSNFNLQCDRLCMGDNDKTFTHTTGIREQPCVVEKYGSFVKESKSRTDIDEICEKYGIKNYTINDDNLVDVDGDLRLNDKGLSGFPVRFGKVTGDFECKDNMLKNLEGGPYEVSGTYDCRYSQLVSLKGSPSVVGTHFDCSMNQLGTLVGGPSYVGGTFDCSYNQLITLEGSPKKVGSHFNCDKNQLYSLEGCPSEIKGAFRCQLNRNLTSLKGCPSIVGMSFMAGDCGLTTLVDGPMQIGEKFYLSNNKIKSLEGFQRDTQITHQFI